MMAEFNTNNKKFGRDIIWQAEENKYLPEEITGSRKHKRAILTVLNKVLVAHIWRMKRSPASICSNDAKSCYDRIIHWVAILAMRRVDAPAEPMKSMFETIQKVVHSVAVGEKLSQDTYQGQDFWPPLHGVGQGNGAGPAIWVMISAVLIEILKSRGYGTTLVTALSRQVKSLVGFTFVNNTDNFQEAPSPWSSAKTVVESTRKGLSLWSGTLAATGGGLEVEKSFWYLLDYSFKDGY